MPVTFAMCAYVCIVGLWQSACYLQLNRHQFQATPHRNSSATGVEARLGKLVGARGRLRASRCGVAGMWRHGRRGRAEQPAAEKRVRPRMLLAAPWRRWAPPSQAQCIAGAAALLAVADGRKLSCRAAGIQRGLLQSFSRRPLASRSEVTYSPGPPQRALRSARRAATAWRRRQAQVPWRHDGAVLQHGDGSTLAALRTSAPAPS